MSANHHVFTIGRRGRQFAHQFWRAGPHFSSQSGRQFAANPQLAFEARRQVVALRQAGRQVAPLFAVAVPMLHFVAVVLAVPSTMVAIFAMMIFVVAVAMSVTLVLVLPVAVAMPVTLGARSAAGEGEYRTDAQSCPPSHLHRAS